ncbi:MAG: aldehyde dehydrogenase family protein, partial [Gammaproteobacteria bacterium]
MSFRSINPTNGNTLRVVDAFTPAQLESALQAASAASAAWRLVTIDERSALLQKAAARLREQAGEFAAIITLEMGKPIREARAEIEKCAWVCEYYAEQGPAFLADEPIESDAGRSLVAWQPLGTVLAVMPWNFPFWQVFRFAAPALMAGNTGLLKHASNVPQCALAIEAVFTGAGFPDGVFRSLMIPSAQVAGVIGDPRVKAVTLT